MRAVGLWLRAWRWPRIVAVGLSAVLIASAAGFVMLAALAAHRADTGWDELRARTRDSDLLLDAGTLADARALAEESAAVRGVSATSAIAYGYLVPAGRVEDFYGGTILAIGPRSSDEVWRPVVLRGRRADPDRVDEVVVNEEFVRVSGRHVGDDVVLVDPFGLLRQRVRVVGVGVMPVDFTFGAGAPLAFPTYAFSQRWERALRGIERRGGAEVLGGAVAVRTTPGIEPEVVAARLERAVPSGRITGVNTIGSSASLVVDTLEFQRNGYLVLGVTAALATLVMAGLVLARTIRLRPEEAESLRAIGFAPRELRLAALVPGVVAVLLGVTGAVVVAVLGRSFVPSGLADQVSAGSSAGDTGVLLVVVLVAAVLLGGMAAVVAAPPARTSLVPPRGRRPALRLLRWPAVAVGVRAAAGGQSRAGRRQAVGAVIVIAVAVAGVVAVGIVLSSRSHLYSTPGLAGKFFDIDVSTYTDTRGAERDRALLAASSAVTGLATVDIVHPEVDGLVTEAIVVHPVKGFLGPPVLDGVAPRGVREVAVTPGYLGRSGKDVGDRLALRGPAGRHSATIVGTVVVPFAGPSAAGEQLVLTPAGGRALGLEPDGVALAVRVRDRAAVRAVRAPNDDLEACDTAQLLPLLGVKALPGARAQEVVPCATRLDQRAANLRELGEVPTLAIVFLALLGVAGLAYLLGAGFRRTSHDLAVLRSIGFTRGQTTAAGLVQALVVLAVALLVALPIGIAAGRWSWHTTVDDLGFVDHAIVSGATLLLVLVVTLVVGLLLAVVPALLTAFRPARDRLRVE